MDATERFSTRADAYVLYRPGYPEDVPAHLARECSLDAYTQVADIGSGTGILSKLLLDYGCEVTGVEPNAKMRAAAERHLGAYERFTSTDGRAEETGLADDSFDLVTAAQSFHWFEPAAARSEFARILRPPRWVALIWNERLTEGEFLGGYEDLLRRFAPDYDAADHRRVGSAEIGAFFGHQNWSCAAFANQQVFDLDGIRGRLESSSYAPLPGSDEYRGLVDGLRSLFARCQQNGAVTLRYRTTVYTGTL